MGWNEIIAHGNGRVEYALVIEGWPEIFVTDHRLTLTESLDGRTVRVGLQRSGLSFSERAMLSQGKIEASSMTFRINGNDHRDTALASLARVGRVAGTLAQDLETDDDTMHTMSGCPGVDYYHIGTEVIHASPEGPGANPWPITRGHWDTQPQSFYLRDGQDLLTHRVYYHPRTMEGRRGTLYVWGDGDDGTEYDPTGANDDVGRPIWRGVVGTPPRLDAKGVAWTITLDHVASLFRQSIAARNKEIRPVGIYASTANPIYVSGARLTIGGGLTYTNPNKHVLFATSHEDFIDQMNEILDDLRTSGDSELSTFFASLTLHYDPAVNQYSLQVSTVASPPPYGGIAGLYDGRFVFLSSHITGTVVAGLGEGAIGAQPWVDLTGVYAVYEGGNGSNDIGGSTVYNAPIQSVGARTTRAGEDTTQLWFRKITHEPVPGGFNGSPIFRYRIGTDSSTLPSNADLEEWTERRVWINEDWSALSATAITVDRSSIEAPAGSEGEGSLEFTVEDYGSDFGTQWILLSSGSTGSSTGKTYGWIHGDTVIRPTYVAAGPGDATTLITTLIDAVAANANDGNLPFIRDVDYDTSSVIYHRHAAVTAARSFRFSKAVSLEDVIAQELLMTGHMWSVDKDSSKLRIIPIPLLTASIAATLDDEGDQITIGRAQIQTPAGGSGSMPTYEVQSQGIVSTVNIRTGYSPGEDEHHGTTHVVNDADLLSTHKRRGVTDLTIAPKSTGPEPSVEQANEIAATMLAALGREYASVKVQVPFTRFRVMLGDVVLLTSPHVPNARGTRGVSNERCMVIGRRWNLDPGRNDHGELELLMLLDSSAVAGYAPGGFITSQSGSVATWTLTLLASHPLNILISPRNDGHVAATFAVGDAIVIVQMDNDDARDLGDTYTGTVTAVSGDTVSVALDATWVPGSDGWTLQYDVASACTDTQRAYCFVAGEDGLIDDEEHARQFS